MASKNKTETKYTFKGNKAENKYSNIFQDLNNKEEMFKENSLKKIHKSSSVEEDDNSVENRFSIKSVSSDQARENALKRKQASKNEQIIATQKSSPVVSHRISPEFDRMKSIERLKREKKASQTEGTNNFKENTEDIDLGMQDTLRINNLGEFLTEEQMLNNPKTIREEAKERVSMDKSKVEIYKEYSDFERNPHYDNKNNSNSELDGFEDLADSNKNMSYEEEIKKRESEIEELIRLMKNGEKPEKTSRVARKASKNQKKEQILKKNSTDESNVKKYNFRNDVYKKNSQKNEPRINFKKLGLVFVIAFVLILFIAAGIDKYLSSRNNESNTSNTSTKTTNTSTKTNGNKSNNTVTTKTSESKEDKIKKIEAIRSKLNVDESGRLDYIIENIDSYPDEFISLLSRNAETVDYVYSYKDKDKYNNKALSKNISSSYYVDGSVPLFLQWDRRWGYRSYGKEYIGLTGCGPTSLAMVIRHFDRDSGINPYDVAKYSQENGYVSKDNYTSWSLFEKGLSNYNLESKDVLPVEAKMKKALDDGQVLIVSVNPGVFTERGHIIVIKGYNRNGDFLINDPNSIINTNKSWSFDELKDQIRKIWGVSSTTNKNDTSSTKDTTDSKKTTSSDNNTSSGSSDDPSIIQDIN